MDKNDFVLYVAGDENEWVLDALNIAEDDGLVVVFDCKDAGSYGNETGRIRYRITCSDEKKARELRRRLRCKYSGVMKQQYNICDKHGRYISERG